MEKTTKKPSFSIGRAFLDGTFFLIFGPKNWQKGKKIIPPVYIAAGAIVFFIFVSIIKSIWK